MITAVSDAQPLQYFHKSVPTFNEDKKQPGIDFRPFFANFFFDSVIKSQYLGNAAYDLVVTDDTGVELYRVVHAAIVAGVYQTQFVPQDSIIGLVNGSKIRCCIVDPASKTDSFDSSFDSSFHPLFTGLIYRTDSIQCWYGRRDLKKLFYSNAVDYAQLSGYTTDIFFELVVKAKFRKRRFPETNESENLDKNTVVKLSSSVKKQKLLQVEPAPDSFHLKILFALQHNTVIIDNQKWLKEEAYDKKELNEHCDLSVATVFLTEEENDYFANVYGETALEPTTTTTTATPHISCLEYTISNTGVGVLHGQYDSCDGITHEFTIAEGGSALVTCALDGSVMITSGTGTIEQTGVCGTTTTTTMTPPTTTTTTPLLTTTTTTPVPTTTTTTPTPTTTTTTVLPDCLQYRLSNNSDESSYDLHYDDCDGFTQHLTPGPGSTITICTRNPDSIILSEGASVTITLLGACP